MPDSSEIIILKDEAELITRLASEVEKAAAKAIAEEDVFKIGLSGGSMVKFLEKGLPGVTTEWSKWRFFFCDERIVPADSVDSTFGAYRNALIGKIPITEDQFVNVDPDMSAEAAAKDYIQKMAVHFPPDSLPRFHLLLLGVGPDGHTCSLFPDHRLLEETSVWVAPITNSPKPPPTRITLTFPVVNNAAMCLFALTGASKATMVKRILVDNESLPAARVQPTDGRLVWLLDQAAATHVQQ